MPGSGHTERHFKATQASRVVTLCWLVALCSALAACDAAIPVAPTASTSTETPVTSATELSASPTPSVDLSISETHWVEFPQQGEWALIGTLTNREPHAVEEVMLSLQLPGSPSIQTLETTPIPAQIQPSAEALFQFRLPDGSRPQDYALSYSAKISNDDSLLEIKVDVLERRQALDGGLMLLGEVQNQGAAFLHLKAVYILLLDYQDIPLGIAVSEHILPSLAPNDRSPFSASSASYIEADSWKAFVEAIPEKMPPALPLEITDGFNTETTARGYPFFLGFVENRGVTPWWLNLDVVYSQEGQMLGMDTLALPFPLPPRDRTAFILDPSQALPPATWLQEEPGKIEIQFYPDAWKSLPSLEEPFQIPVAITQFEQIGSQLYLQAELTNTLSVPVFDAVIYLRVNDVRGRIRTVGWSDSLQRLPAGETQNLRINLPIPKDLALNLAEFDVRAFAFMQGQSH